MRFLSLNIRFLCQHSQPDQAKLKKYSNRFIWAKQLPVSSPVPEIEEGGVASQLKQGDFIGCSWGVMSAHHKLELCSGTVKSWMDMWGFGILAATVEEVVILTKNVELGATVPFLCWRLSEWAWFREGEIGLSGLFSSKLEGPVKHQYLEYFVELMNILKNFILWYELTMPYLTTDKYRFMVKWIYIYFSIFSLL